MAGPMWGTGWLHQRPTLDVVVLMLTGLVLLVIGGATITMAALQLAGLPGAADLALLVNDHLGTILGALLGLIAGQASGRREGARGQYPAPGAHPTGSPPGSGTGGG